MKKTNISATIEKNHSITINYMGQRVHFDSKKKPTKKDLQLMLHEVRCSVIAIKHSEKTPNTFYLYQESELNNHLHYFMEVEIADAELAAKIAKTLIFNGENEQWVQKVLPFLENNAIC